MSLPQALRATSLSVIFLSSILLPGCAQHSAPAATTTKAAPLSAEAQRWNDTALFLAGLPGRPDGPFKSLEDTAAWKRYAAEFDETWKRVEHDQFTAVDAFQKRELAPIKTGSDFVFYPFAGPDVIYATRFFPDAKLMVFAGLEPAGSIARANKFNEQNLDKELHGLSQSVASIFNRSFFVTREMDSSFRGRVTDGLLPVMLLLLSRSGYQIEGVTYGRLSEDGQFAVDDPSVRHAPPASLTEGEIQKRNSSCLTDCRENRGVEIGFKRPGDSETRKLYYFSTDLAFEKTSPFLKFVAKQGKPDTLVKSASFLLHWKMCTSLRNWILENSNLIFQDDTGVPYRYLSAPEWTVTLYGKYSAPDRPFTSQYQKDLAAAFQDDSRVKDLGFSIGYGSGRRSSSMILARRAKATTGAD